ncbi:MAG: butyrate kinase [Bacteroidales bacterium]|jgi:butyrate kinase|nr:butyrate kinase [Bacteroidales bacterium]
MLALIINPGSTSTKIAVYQDRKQIFTKTLRHSPEELKLFPTIASQFEFRKNIILSELKGTNINITDFQITMGRGGLCKPIPSGVYEVNEALKNDLKIGVMGQHASNLGGLIADDIAKGIPNAKAYIADPVVVDELDDIARISGLKEIKRVSIFHALNQKIIAKKYAAEIHRPYESLNLIAAHLGGGVSVGIHKNGRVVETNNGLLGEGPLTPERSGGLPAMPLVELCFSGNYSKDEILKLIAGKGGFASYFGTNDAREAERMSETDPKAKLIFDAFIYQTTKEIGAMATVVAGKVDAILLTGGMAYSQYVTEEITKRVSFIAKVKVYPGEDEMEALAENAFGILDGSIEAKRY